MFNTEHLYDVEIYYFARYLAMVWDIDELHALIASTGTSSACSHQSICLEAALQIVWDLGRQRHFSVFLEEVLIRRGRPNRFRKLLLDELRATSHQSSATEAFVFGEASCEERERRQLENGQRVASTIAQVIVGAEIVATGILIGPDTLLTCAHAIYSHGIEKPEARANVTIRFCRPTEVEVELANEGWVVPLGEVGSLGGGLDYGILRLREAIGDKIAAEEHAVRGWIHLGRYSNPPTVECELQVISHSGGQNLSWLPARDAVYGDGLIHYRAQTHRGASGGLLYDARVGGIVGLHIGNPDPDASATDRAAEAYAAIAIKDIWRDLQARNLAHLSPLGRRPSRAQDAQSPILEIADNDNEPVVNRLSFVDAMRSRFSHHSATAGTVTCINGDTGCGKSFAQKILSTLVSAHRHTVLYIDDDPRKPTTKTPQGFYEKLLARMDEQLSPLSRPGVAPRPISRTNTEQRQATQLVEALRRRLGREPVKTFWIVVDDAISSSPDVLRALHDAVATMPRLHLIFINYEAPPDVGPYHSEIFNQISDGDVRTYFDSAREAYGWLLPANELDALVSKLLSALPPVDAVGRTRALASAVRHLRDLLNSDATPNLQVARDVR